MQARAGTLYAPGLTYVPPALGGGSAPAGPVTTMPTPLPADFDLTDRRFVNIPSCAFLRQRCRPDHVVHCYLHGFICSGLLVGASSRK